MRSAGLEAPFVGRDRELRLVKELFHASAEERRAQLVLGHRDRRHRQVAAGVGVREVHRRPRCRHVLAPRPLPLLRRGRRVLGARRDGAHALRDRRGRGRRAPRARSSRATLEEHLPDAEERALGRAARSRTCSASRTARPATRRTCSPPGGSSSSGSPSSRPTVLVFEDVQWADAGLLDFIEYLLDWSRSQPLFVLALARPELAEKRPTWGAGKRGFTQLYLEPLPATAMSELLTGLVPGLPDDLRERGPRPGRGRAAVRRRDGAHAARPRAARAGRRRLPADRRRSRRSRCRRRSTR